MLREFGSLSRAAQEAGLPATSWRKISKEEIGKELKRIAESFGPISGPLIKQHAPFSIDSVSRKYGSIQKACLEIGVPFKESTHKFVSKEDLDKEVFRIRDKYGYVSKPLMEKYAIYGPKIVNRIYGNFGNMYKALGIDRHPSGRSPSKDDLIKEFKRIYEKYGLISQSIVGMESKYSTTCYKDRFGSFNNLREILGIPKVLPGQSLNADYCIEKVEGFLGERAEKEKTFDWLVNPKTGYNLRLDAFFQKHMLAVEYNGPQHYVVDGTYTATQKDLDHRKWLDSIKEQLVRQHGIKIVWVSFKDKLDTDYMKTHFA